MMPSEFDEFASLWRHEVSDDEQRAFAALAERSRRRARLIDRAELGLAALLVTAVAGLLILSPAPATVVVGLIAAVGLSWSSWKRHLLHQASAAAAGGSHDDYVGSAIAVARAATGRARLGVLLYWPFVLIGLLFGQSIREGGRLQGFVDRLVERATDMPSGPILTLVLVGLFVMIIRSHRRLKSELERLLRLQQEYRDEQANEDGADG